ncbi:MAG: DUF4870 domain-containing protein [Rubrobacteraceae bacterium]
MREDPNYGKVGDTGDEIAASGDDTTEGMLAERDERIWSALAHASVVLWPFTGFLPVAPLLIWLVYKDRSSRVGFHALQSLWYQVAWLVIFVLAGLLGTTVGVLLTLVTFGLALFVLVPLAFVAPIFGLTPFVHQLYAAYKVSRDADYRYPLLADRIDGGPKEVWPRK